MRVLMFGWEFPPHITGGLGTACFGLSQAMINLGMEILFVVPKMYGDEDQNKIKLVSCEDVTYDRTVGKNQDFTNKFSYMEVNSTLLPYQTEEQYYALLNQIQNGVSRAQTIYSEKYLFSGGYGANLYEEVERYALVAGTIASKERFDIIHAHDWLTYKAGVEAKRVSGMPLTIHVHATEFDRSGEDNINTHVYEIEKYGMDHADRIFAVSNLTRNIIIQKYGQPAEKVYTVHNGVDFIQSKSTTYTRDIPEKIVTFLGRITFQKGPDYFIEAAKLVLDREPNVRFVMAGSGDMFQRMVDKVAMLGLSDRFHFTGFLRGEEVDHMFALSDIYVMPSVSEPFGISPLEAMSSGVPTIISKQSGVSEVLEYAIKVDFWDVEALADVIFGLLRYPVLHGMLKKRGEAEVHSIRWETAARLLERHYTELLK